MSDFIVYDARGKILRTGSCPPDYVQHQGLFDNSSVIAGTADMNINYIDNGVIAIFPVSPDNYHVWDWPTKKWVQPANYLANAINDATIQVNTMAGDKILGKYPDWKQRNMTARMLQLVKLGTPDNAEGLALQAVWAWIESVRAASNTANMQISACITVTQIQMALSTYQTALVAL